MMKVKLQGIVVPMVTPFKSDSSQNVDEGNLRNLVNFLIDSGVHALIPCGGTGESVSLSPEENKQVIGITVDEANGRVPVMGGAKSPGTRNSVNLARDAKDAGADGVMIIAPYYLSPIKKEGYYEQFRAVAEEVDIPVLLYNLSRMQSEDLPVDVVARLADLDNVIGLKNSTANVLHITEAIKVCKEKKIAYLQGQAQMFVPSLILGSQGSITSILNAVPAIWVDIYNSFIRGDFERARELHFKLLPLIKLGGSPVVVKAALNMLGVEVGVPRKPLMPATENEKKKIKVALQTLGLETVKE